MSAAFMAMRVSQVKSCDLPSLQLGEGPGIRDCKPDDWLIQEEVQDARSSSAEDAPGLVERQDDGLDLSIAASTSPLRAVAILPLSDFHEVSRAAGPK
jgi:hypothetical protein